MYESIKKILEEKRGKCLIIENGKPLGVVLTMEEYELLRSGFQNPDFKSQTNPEPQIKEEAKTKTEESLISEISNKPEVNPIGEAMVGEMNFPGASATMEDIDLADDVTLEDLGIDDLPY